MNARPMIVALLALVACSSAPPTDPPDLLDDPSPRTRSGRSDDAVLEGAPLEPAPSSSSSSAPSGSGASPSSAPPNVFRGTASTTNSFGFGGDPYACTWQISMKSLALDLHADAASGAVTTATFTARAVEQTMPPCEATPYPPNDHVYTMTKAATIAPNVTRITLAPKSTNEPQASATIDVDLSKAPGTATIEIHRTDQGPPLDWTIKAKLTLESK